MSAVIERPKFWSDDFDADLLKVFPDAPKMLCAPDRALWTVGHTTHGRLNHPAVWNTHGAFLWTERPELPRDKSGWTNVRGCVTPDPLVECTWLEWMRDVWVHGCGAIVLPAGVGLPSTPQDAFFEIMYDIRKCPDLVRDLGRARRRAIEWIIRCDAIMERIR